ncbi:MAG: IS66 family insertion sequence element accessory protein TnpB [Balneolaceae bacterium]
MLETISVERVYLACGSTDMRKSINGLVILVQEHFQKDPFEGTLFVFCNKQRNKIKILRWEHSGFWLYYKRLEKDRFKWPTSMQGPALKLTTRELRWLLDGLSLEQKSAHKEVAERVVV